MKSAPIPLTGSDFRDLQNSLLGWYDEHRRDLPWRADRDPYRVWVSEIMLQQTRVAAVLDHYARFLKRFPTVQALAAAREPSVLALWSGLGYYHRARRMHQAAKVIAREKSGCFPATAEQWLELPGIGRYTAAAIASIAFGEAVAVVDGNVERVLERLFAVPMGKAGSWEMAEALRSRERPGDFNQAMMELGATICTPRAPQCLVCPVVSWCGTRGAGVQRPQATRKRDQLCYGWAERDGAVFLVQRDGGSSLMAGMWELPSVPADQESMPLAKLRHSITDTDYDVIVTTLPRKSLRTISRQGRWCTRAQWQRLPLTGLTRKLLLRLTA